MSLSKFGGPRATLPDDRAHEWRDVLQYLGLLPEAMIEVTGSSDGGHLSYGE
jgi:hypothetical protein